MLQGPLLATPMGSDLSLPMTSMPSRDGGKGPMTDPDSPHFWESAPNATSPPDGQAVDDQLIRMTPPGIGPAFRSWWATVWPVRFEIELMSV